MVKVYDIATYLDQILVAANQLDPKINSLPSTSEIIRALGVKSCQFVVIGSESYWEFSDIDYTFFNLRFSK